MRISNQQHQIISSVIKDVLGETAQVYLFGSRTDDNAKGGDIDLLVESSVELENAAEIKSNISAKLYIAFNGLKVDVLLMAPNLKKYPIHDIAKKNGILL